MKKRIRIAETLCSSHAHIPGRVLRQVARSPPSRFNFHSPSLPMPNLQKKFLTAESAETPPLSRKGEKEFPDENYLAFSAFSVVNRLFEPDVLRL